ncbi:MAG: hypothetical protein ACRBN8_10140 [Nannocystales bacterium]
MTTDPYQPPGGVVGRGLMAGADVLRLRWLRALGPLGARLARDRELRVSVIFSAVVVSALLGTLVAPLWLLVLGPLVWGVPHIAADIRYLVVRTGFGHRRLLWVLGGLPLLMLGAGVDLVWGFVGAAGVALVARAPLARRLLAAAVVLGIGLGLDHLGPSSDIVFGHLHNFGAVAFWWAWRARRGRMHWLPLVLLVAASCLLLSHLGVELVGSGFEWHATGDSADRQLWRLAQGLAPMLGMRLVLLFCFMQSVHYAMWLQMIPDEERRRSTVMTFRASAQDLERDFDRVALWVIAALAAALIAWACFDMLAAGQGYFRVARFHGTLEVMAAVLLILERAPRRA